MRHCKKKGRLNRKTGCRKATLRNLANSLFTYQRIETTMAKAKALRSYTEPLITLAKNNPGSISARRQAFRKLCDKDVVKSLFDELSPLYKKDPGGYTRIILLGRRKGDGARMAIVELTKRTISDEKLLKTEEKKEPSVKRKQKKVSPKALKKEPEAGEAGRGLEKKKAHAAPEVAVEDKEKRSVEDVKKEKAKTEQKKVTKKGIFRRFQRKSMG